MRRRVLLVAAASAALVRRTAARDDPWSALHEGGVAILLRHAQTEPGLGDPPGYRLDDCSTQRNLSEAGRAQARRIGAAFAARGVRIDRVLSSEWCRCLETARLAFPKHRIEPWPALNSFFDDRAAEPRSTREALARVLALQPPVNVVLVTHHVNIAALTGVAAGSGEAVLVRPNAGEARVLGRLQL